MTHKFSLDLRCARRKAGLLQADCGHLLGGSVSKIRQLEQGQRLPTLYELCALSLIYGRTFETLYGELFAEVRKMLAERMETLPKPISEHAHTYNRKATLEALAERLLEETGHHYGG